jgi:hypothetical protein
MVVLVSAGKAAWLEVVLNWMVLAHKVRVYNYVLLPLDLELHDALSRVEAPSFLPPDLSFALSQEPLYRWKLVFEALNRGINVIYCDPSAIFLRSVRNMWLAHASSARK